MGLLRNRTRRFSRLGLISDLFLVGTAAGRMVQRRNGSGTGSAASGPELALAGGAAYRLARRWLRRRKRRKLPSSAD
jgi:hypothetical protein